MENEDLLIELGKVIQYSFTIPSFLQSKLQKHLQLLKLLRHPEKNQHNWIISAIHKKLSSEKSSLNISKGKNLNVKLEKELAAKVDERIFSD